MYRFVRCIALCITIAATNLGHRCSHAEAGRDWKQHTPLPALRGAGCLVFQGKVWMLGGHDGTQTTSSIWSSTDNGESWVLETSSPGWSPRRSFGATIHNGEMWIAGGDGLTNDVWSSANGVNWTLKTASAAWSGRMEHALVSYLGQLRIIGGFSTFDFADQWASVDGITWVNSGTPNWSARRNFATVVHAGELYLLGGLQTAGTVFHNDVWRTTNGFTWANMTGSAAWAARYNHRVLSVGGKIYVIGGIGGGSVGNNIYSSPDGFTWTQEVATAPYTVRNSFGCVHSNGEMLIIGGLAGTASSAVRNDTWYSANGTTWNVRKGVAWDKRGVGTCMTAVLGNELLVGGGTGKSDVWGTLDGVSWTQKLASGAPNSRDFTVSLTYNNRVWLLGGQAQNDVRWSSDGITWNTATASAAWAARTGHQAVVHNGKMWVLGGMGTSANLLKDVWSSTDGIAWTVATASAPWDARKDFAAASFNGKLWVLGGNSGTDRNDVWSSTDGISWTMVTGAAPWNARHGFSALPFGGRLYVVGGNGDVWNTGDGISWTNSTTEAAYGPSRRFAGNVVFNNRLYSIAGTGAEYNARHDMWSTELTTAPLVDSITVRDSDPALNADPYAYTNTQWLEIELTGLDAEHGTTVSFAESEDFATSSSFTYEGDNHFTYSLLPGSDGVRTVYAKAHTTSASSELRSDMITLDVATPQTQATAPAGAINQAVTLGAADPDPTGSPITSTTLYVRHVESASAWSPVTNLADINDTFEYAPSNGTGTYLFQAQSLDSAGNRQLAPSGIVGSGDSVLTYETDPVTTIAVEVEAGESTQTFELEDDVEVAVILPPGTTGGTLQIRRNVPRIPPPASFQHPEYLLDESLTITADFPISNASLQWKYDAASVSSPLVNPNTVFQVDGGVLNQTYSATLDSTTLYWSGVNGLSEWYAGTPVALPVQVSQFTAE